MKFARHKLLWVDGLAGLTAGTLMLLAAAWIDEWYGLPLQFLYLVGGANVAYGLYSTALASRVRRPKELVLLLILGNLTWAVLCIRWALLFRETASPLGLAHLLAEALIVGGLGILEWRWRADLLTRPDRRV